MGVGVEMSIATRHGCSASLRSTWR
jgi:hypothetical protein